jgi:tol-pal system protein YbgF
MQSKLDDLTMSLSRLSGEVETLTHDLQVEQKALSEAAETNKALINRISKLEGAVQVLQTMPAAPAPTAAPGQLPANAAPVAAPPGAPDTSAAPGGADEILAYRQARQVLDTGDYAGGAAALQDYLARYPTSPRALEANYWLGRTLGLQAKYPEAADAFARSLKGWPQAAWAGDAVVRLAGSLVEMKRADDACKALAEFDGRYAAKSAAAIKLRAKDVRTRAACG